MGSRQDRKTPRYRVHLQVSYRQAAESVTEYVENISRGGLFVKGAHQLAPLEQVSVDLLLPGAGSYRVGAEVAHVIDEEAAISLGRSPGAGLSITERPDGFDEALVDYLSRLGRRADVMVMAESESFGRLLAGAGFQVSDAPPPRHLLDAVARAEIPVAAVVVSSENLESYLEAARLGGATDKVHAIDHPDDFEALLSRLDRSI